MSRVKHTPVSGVHPDLTAWRAVDACGGTYTPAEEASGWADGHRAALASAMVAVGRADSITAELLEFAVAFRRMAEATTAPINTDAALNELGDDHELTLTVGQFREFYHAACAAIARARGEQ
ncbi:hypothetical protein D3C80_1196220 [compost metagenome]